MDLIDLGHKAASYLVFCSHLSLKEVLMTRLGMGSLFWDKGSGGANLKPVSGRYRMDEVGWVVPGDPVQFLICHRSFSFGLIIPL
jgi:hypothetical protein